MPQQESLPGVPCPDQSKVALSVADDAKIEQRFSELVAAWKAGRGHVASINKWVQQPAYQRIIDLGRKHKDEIISLLLRELEQSPDHWFWALKELTGVNPVTSECRGSVIEMAKCWITWGREQGYRW